MWIHYPDRVEESEDLLLNQERRLRCSPLADALKYSAYSRAVAIAARRNWPRSWATAIGHYADGGSPTNNTACPVCWLIQAMAVGTSASHPRPGKP